MKQRKRIVVIVAGLGAASMCPGTFADVKLPAVLSDGMVVQQNAPARFWGWARAGEVVRARASWSAAEVVVSASERGEFLVEFPPAPVGGPHSITIAGDTAVTITNILSGELWVCSGQSNMEWPLSAIGAGDERRGLASAASEVRAANYPSIRLFTVPNTISAHPRIDTPGASWRVCSAETAGGFSAVGYFFGRTLHKDLEVPIGLISADWGGTPAESWSSERALATFPAYAESLALLDAAKDPARRGVYIQRRQAAWWSSLDTLPGGPGADWTSGRGESGVWRAVRLPASYSTIGLQAFDGVAYFTRSVDVPGEWLARASKGEVTLELGPIDDRDDAFINGRLIGSTRDDGQWSTARKYVVPSGVLREGENIVGVRVLDTAGEGGINGKPEQLVLRAADPALPTISLAGAWKFATGTEKGKLPPIPESAAIGPNTPTVLRHGMIDPLVNLNIAGVIWYQGESNVGRAEQYRRLFPSMIEDWRGSFRNPALPFLFVQIAPYGYGVPWGMSAELREAQARTLSLLANTSMVCTMDLGNPRDIHPGNKQEVGRRLALAALRDVYGKKNISAAGPSLESFRFDGGAARLRLANARGLTSRDGAPLSCFVIAGADKRFHPARATVDGSDIVVQSSAVAVPAAVRFAWGNADEPNLINDAGFPAGPFRTDDWSDGELAPEDVTQAGVRPSDGAFKALFNGSDFAGWKFGKEHEGHWRVAEGRIVFDGEGADLWTADSFKNFVLICDWRWTGKGVETERPVILPTGDQATDADGKPLTKRVADAGDSGVYLRGSSKSQVNMWCWPIGSGEVYGYRTDASQPAAVRAGVTPRAVADAPIGEWNRFVITMNGDRLTVVLNGVMVLENASLPGVAESGPIALQMHHSPIEFAHIYLKALP